MIPGRASRPALEARHFWRWLAFASLSCGVLAGSAMADPAPDPGHPYCAAALADHPGLAPVAALRAEESERWKRARAAAREGRKSLRRSLGAGPSSRVLAGDFERADGVNRQSMSEARTFCECRARLGDPDGAPCDRLYYGVPSLPASQSIPAEASASDSGS